MESTASTTRFVDIFATSVDLDAPSDALALRGYRKSRLHEAVARRDLAAIVLFNPINIRYACDARNMQVYGLHNPCRYVFMAADGHTSLFEFRNCEHLSKHLETVDEIRPVKAWYHMAAGANVADAGRGAGHGRSPILRASTAAPVAVLPLTGSTRPARRRFGPRASCRLTGWSSWTSCARSSRWTRSSRCATRSALARRD
jgi:hypothetical protein